MRKNRPGRKSSARLSPTQPMKSTTRTVLLVVSGLISAAMLVYIFINFDWQTVQSLTKHMRWPWIGLSFVVYFFSILLRTERFKNLLYSRPVGNWELFTVTSLHNMFNYILPARSGEFSYLFLTKDRLKVSLVEGSASLFASRVYDFLSTALILLMVLPFAWNRLPAWVLQGSLTFCAVVIGACALIFFAVSRAQALERFSPTRPWLARLWSIFKRMVAGLQEIQRKQVHYRVGLLTAGIWACLYTNLFFICRALDYPVDYFQVILVSLTMIPLSLMPVQGFANLGTHELAWVTIMMVFGASYQTALDVAVGTHFLVMSNVLFYGLLSLLMLRCLPRRNPPPDETQGSPAGS